MFQILANLFDASTKNTPRQAPPVRRRTRLGFDALEGRQLPSVSPIQGAIAAGPYQIAQTYYPANVAYVPNLSGVSFHLLSANGKPAHDLVIQNETFAADGSANFTGTWTGDGANGGNAHQILNGTLKYDANGNLKISFAWANGSGSQNSLSGTITRVNSYPATAASPYGVHWHLDGDVTTSRPGGGPGHVYGNGGILYPVAKAAL
jgi:hypothetical protein